jgi:hypothetical protein
MSPRIRAFAVASLTCLAASVLHSQQQFQLFLFADSGGRPVTDLRADEIALRENGESGRVVRLERHRLPLKVTVLIDNGASVPDALAHQRTGLRGFFDALPSDVEVALIATAPNPRWLVRPTADRVRIAGGIRLLTPDQSFPRANDALVEYGERLIEDFRNVSAERPQPYLPVLVSIGTTGRDGSTAQRDALARMMQSLVRYRVRLYVVMISPGGPGGLNDGAHALVAKAAQELTGGRYDALATTIRLTTLLPEIGRDIAAAHVKQTNQYRATLERPAGASGPLKDLQVSIGRNGITYIMTLDGRLP